MGEEIVRTLAVDLGGTRMRAALVTPEGEVASRRTMTTPQDAACPDALMGLVGDVLAGADVADAVIGVPGRVDHRRGRLEHAPNLPPHWPAALDERLLSERFGVAVALANDADVAAVGEAYFGAGRPYADVVYLTISTGVGAGVLLAWV
jgi:glucokinase